ncbi:unnamed protein product [Sphagnum jensenii]|uniref:MORN repeat-containing protein 3 n=1 Tax=Sphagnum jensenii TaxID=128206 RepID=A0ABP0W7B8_9BRYO
MDPTPKLSSDKFSPNVETTNINDESILIERHSHYLDRISNKEGYRATMYWTTGDFYCGEWHNNLRDGRGIHTFKSGNRYEGQFKEGKREGHGTFWVVNGKYYCPSYRGSWKANYFHGLGLLYGKCGEMYEGYFENGKRCGMGKQTYRDWTSKDMSFHIYIGEWVDNKRDGVGTLRMVNGNVYQGHFKNDLKEGMGVFYFKDQQSKYEGLWRVDVATCGSYSREVKGLDEFEMPFLMLPNHKAFVKKCLKLAIERPLHKHYFLENSKKL